MVNVHMRHSFGPSAQGVGQFEASAGVEWWPGVREWGS